jgi:hypothetical protein
VRRELKGILTEFWGQGKETLTVSSIHLPDHGCQLFNTDG